MLYSDTADLFYPFRFEALDGDMMKSCFLEESDFSDYAKDHSLYAEDRGLSNYAEAHGFSNYVEAHSLYIVEENADDDFAGDYIQGLLCLKQQLYSVIS